MHAVIRRYRSSDRDPVRRLFVGGIQEHIKPAFTRAMSMPLHITATVLLAGVGYAWGGGSLLPALLAPAAWVGMVYCCCREFFAGYVRERLQTDMKDVQKSFLSSPDSCFWVAEARVNGRSEVMGMVAVEAKREAGGERFGELFRMIVSPAARRTGLGSRLTQTAIDFCKERGFSKVVLHTSSTQEAAVALYRKTGFAVTDVHYPVWIAKLIGVTVLRMEHEL
ncbi:N-acetyltransferase family 8 member 3-like [Denticeps clupeoides]|uniref:N-acetyltransferase family 8 member 3-like n=1 Tax=Denticeps clupeoides TaxID=299321 RepID=UPI0010A2E12D|nr:N-acetyltransferase family 8 member 3-like [Denticeps clupeoides]